MIRAAPPKVPIEESFIMASIFSLFLPPQNPSAQSDNPSRCIPRVRTDAPISYFADEAEGRSHSIQATPEEQAEMDAEKMEGVEFVTRSSLLDRPPLKEVPGEPGHWVSTHGFD